MRIFDAAAGIRRLLLLALLLPAAAVAQSVTQANPTAQASGGLNFNHTWHAYLSQEQRGNTPRLNARDRIGNGPWYNAKGQLIASSVADLHGDQQRDRNKLFETALNNMSQGL